MDTKSILFILKRAMYTALLTSSIMIAVVLSAHADGCLKGSQPTGIGGSKSEWGVYLCTHTGSSGAKQNIQIQFRRLNELAISDFLKKGDETLRIGKVRARLHKNAVYKEINKIYRKFAVRSGGTYVTRKMIPTRFGESDDASNGYEDTPQNYSSVSHYEPGIYGFPILGGPFSKNISLFYSCGDIESENVSIDQYRYFTSAWRYITKNDLDDFDINLRKYSRLIDDQSHKEMVGGMDSYGAPQYFKFLSYITRRGWPADFIYAASDLGGCGTEFTLNQRIILLDVALVTNSSNQPLRIDELIGNMSSSTKLRRNSALERMLSGSFKSLPFGIRLDPGEAIAIPLKIKLAYDGWQLDHAFSDIQCARRIYKRIRSKPAGYDFGEGISSKKFKMPTVPNQNPYTYGPEIVFKGLSIDGNKILFDKPAYNFLALTAGDESGSCPFLYIWDDEDDRWLIQHKVLHKAEGKSAQMIDRVSFDGFRGRFKLAELELELAFIDKVILVLELKAGKKIVLKPALKELSSVDGQYLKIFSRHSISFDFKLPSDIAKSDVLRTNFDVTGYYRRYNSFDISSKIPGSLSLGNK